MVVALKRERGGGEGQRQTQIEGGEERKMDRKRGEGEREEERGDG